MSARGDGGLALLSGVRVVDFTQALSGPYCTMMLADLGADVTKVESPQRGDDARHWGPPFIGDDAAYFMSVNRNKRSVALDLKDAKDRALAVRMITGADVLVENWRPGTAGRLGFEAAQLRAADPRLVYCSISGFGQDRGDRAGYDQIVQGTSGVMHLTGPAGSPTKFGLPIADVAAGMFAATAIVTALFDRTRTGTGATIDIAMQDSLVSMLTHYAARYLNTGTAPASDHNGHATIAPYGLFRTADGFVNVCVGNDSQFQRLCAALARPDLAADPRFGSNPLRLAHKPELLAELDRTLLAIPTGRVIDGLAAAGVPAGPVVDVAQALADPALQARDMVLSFAREDAGTARSVNTPWKFDEQAPSARLAPPRLGEHNDEVIAGLAAGDPATGNGRTG